MNTPSQLGEAPVEIIVAEDSPTQALRLQHILKQQGYRVSVSANGRLALEAARERKPALVISDVVMPEMDGYELCRNIKSDPCLSDVQVILVTTLSDPHDVIRGLECRADNFILKPYDEHYLLNRVRFVLVNREMRQAEHVGLGVDVYFNGEKHCITADRLQILNLLLSTYDAAIQRNKELSTTQNKLREANAELQGFTAVLEQRVAERTEALARTNESLQEEIRVRQEAERKLQAQLARLDLLSRTTRAIGERQDLRSIFQVVLRSLEENLTIDFGCVCLYDEAQTALTVACVGERGLRLALQAGLSEQASIDVRQNGLARCIDGVFVYEPDLTKLNFPFSQRLAHAGLRSLVLAPLLVEGRLGGLLLAALREENSFSSGACEFLRQLSEHVALAANQAQLHESQQRAYDELLQTQQAVMQQERLRAVGQMASGIAHDINNAISPVALYTESLLEREPNLSARARDYLQTIQQAVEDVAATVSRMRQFSREREAQAPQAPVQLTSLIPHVLNLTRARWSDIPQERGKVIEMCTDLASEVAPIQGVESEIRDALTNLILNAADAMPEGGTITLRVGEGWFPTSSSSAPVAAVYMAVSDTGLGMDEETRRRCLEPFFTTKGERGTGLGLAMVYGMAQRHGAEIDVESAPGQGTTVRIRFPLEGAGNLATGGPGVAVHTPLTLRLLLVDDDALLIKSLQATLEIDGHLVTAAHGGQAGIEAFQEAVARGEPFDAVITDLGMPYVDGRQVAAAVKAAAPTTFVILLTGWGQRLVEDGESPPHVDRVLSKPPKMRELREALMACLPVVG